MLLWGEVGGGGVEEGKGEVRRVEWRWIVKRMGSEASECVMKADDDGAEVLTSLWTSLRVLEVEWNTFIVEGSGSINDSRSVKVA